MTQANPGQYDQQFAAIQGQMLRMQQSLTALRVEMDLHKAGQAPALPVEFRSQFGEDVVAWNLFGGKSDGFFIEAGAFDGYNYSVTYAFEAVGWKGLLVEPLPHTHAQCVQRRPNSRVVQAALSRGGASGTADFTVLEDQYGGMLSYLQTTAQHEQVTRWAKRSVVKVPLTSLDALLAESPGQQVDLAVIDVEGGEMDVLDGFDLAKHRPRVLIIEDNSMGRDMSVRNYMAARQYIWGGRLAVNDIYVREDDAEIRERLKWLQLG